MKVQARLLRRGQAAPLRQSMNIRREETLNEASHVGVRAKNVTSETRPPGVRDHPGSAERTSSVKEPRLSKNLRVNLRENG